MKIALAALGFINGNIEYNKNKILSTLDEYSGKADLVVFGECFLQGFDSLCWNHKKDLEVAVRKNSTVVLEIAECCKKNNIAVSFGYIEKDGTDLYSSQLFIGSNGNLVDNYRRISVGWKENEADCNYKEGNGFYTFNYNGIKFATALCGDLWYEENVRSMKELKADVVLWPVYTDFNFRQWNESEKLEYAKQASLCGDSVLYVNSVCMNVEAEEIARGGAAWFYKGSIKTETPAGSESLLDVEI